MSVNAVSQPPAAAAATLNLIQDQSRQKPAATQLTPATSPQDTVHLSSQAKAATADVAHEGDSH